jgi:hypothetical protein
MVSIGEQFLDQCLFGRLVHFGPGVGEGNIIKGNWAFLNNEGDTGSYSKMGELFEMAMFHQGTHQTAFCHITDTFGRLPERKDEYVQSVVDTVVQETRPCIELRNVDDVGCIQDLERAEKLANHALDLIQPMGTEITHVNTGCLRSLVEYINEKKNATFFTTNGPLEDAMLILNIVVSHTDPDFLETTRVCLVALNNVYTSLIKPSTRVIIHPTLLHRYLMSSLTHLGITETRINLYKSVNPGRNRIISRFEQQIPTLTAKFEALLPLLPPLPAGEEVLFSVPPPAREVNLPENMVSIQHQVSAMQLEQPESMQLEQSESEEQTQAAAANEQNSQPTGKKKKNRSISQKNKAKREKKAQEAAALAEAETSEALVHAGAEIIEDSVLQAHAHAIAEDVLSAALATAARAETEAREAALDAAILAEVEALQNDEIQSTTYEISEAALEAAAIEAAARAEVEALAAAARAEAQALEAALQLSLLKLRLFRMMKSSQLPMKLLTLHYKLLLLRLLPALRLLLARLLSMLIDLKR